MREAIDTPGENEEVQTVADHWLTALGAQPCWPNAVIKQVATMIDFPQQ